jgi:hypothetical protein
MNSKKHQKGKDRQNPKALPFFVLFAFFAAKGFGLQMH